MNQYTPTQLIGREPVVVLPLAEYEKLQEDLELLRSKKIPQMVKTARTQLKHGETLYADDLRKALGH